MIRRISENILNGGADCGRSCYGSRLDYRGSSCISKRRVCYINKGSVAGGHCIYRPVKVNNSSSRGRGNIGGQRYVSGGGGPVAHRSAAHIKLRGRHSKRGRVGHWNYDRVIVSILTAAIIQHGRKGIFYIAKVGSGNA